MKAIVIKDNCCHSCQVWHERIMRISKQYQFDVEELDLHDSSHDVIGVPTTIFYDDDGNELSTVIGDMNEDLLINEVECLLRKQ